MTERSSFVLKLVKTEKEGEIDLENWKLELGKGWWRKL